MDKEKIKKWIANIEHYGENLDIGTLRTLGDIKRELENDSHPLEAEVIPATSEADNNNFNNHSVKCRCLECSDVAFRKLE